MIGTPECDLLGPIKRIWIIPSHLMPAIVIMGPSGCGKSTLGKAIAEKLGWIFVEGDDLHPRANIDKMAAGVPLNDSDRKPFLENVASALDEYESSGVVASCSALKRVYRDLIRTRCPEVVFVLPPIEREQLFRQMNQRDGHFMPASLLDSQLSDLETPSPDEAAIDLAGVTSIEEALRRFSLNASGQLSYTDKV